MWHLADVENPIALRLGSEFHAVGNQLTTPLCPGITGLQSLVILDLSNNQLTKLVAELCRLRVLERLDSSHNQIASLELDHLPPSLHHLNLSHNKLETLPDGLLEVLPILVGLDLSFNQLTTVKLTLDRRPPADRGGGGGGADKPQLTSLFLSNNRLDTPPDLSGLSQLKEVTISSNRLASLPLDCFQGCNELVTLDVARNRLGQLPSRGFVSTLPKLTRFDVSSNDLSSLPNELGMMDSLQVLLVDLNPLRTIRQNVLTGGTEAIKALLRQRYEPVEDAPTPVPPFTAIQQANTVVPPPPAVAAAEATPAEAPTPAEQTVPLPKSKADGAPPSLLPAVTSAGALFLGGALSGTGAGSEKDEALPQPLPELSDPVAWSSAAGQKGQAVKLVNLDNRRLGVFPLGLLSFAPTLCVLNLAQNQLTHLPEEIEQFQKLTKLDLARNQLRCLPDALGRLPVLTSLCLDSNPLGSQFDQLEHILLMVTNGDGVGGNRLEHLSLRNCQLDRVPSPAGLAKLGRLVHLDLSDNCIASVPPQLGLCSQLRSLLLGGNTFRVPRPAVLSKGTAAILEYLRSRIPQ